MSLRTYGNNNLIDCDHSHCWQDLEFTNTMYARSVKRALLDCALNASLGTAFQNAPFLPPMRLLFYYPCFSVCGWSHGASNRTSAVGKLTKMENRRLLWLLCGGNRDRVIVQTTPAGISSFWCDREKCLHKPNASCSLNSHAPCQKCLAALELIRILDSSLKRWTPSWSDSGKPLQYCKSSPRNLTSEILRRYLSTSTVACRSKRKNKSSQSPPVPSLLEDSATAEDVTEEEHHHEYADEGYEYADELVERGYHVSQGHCVLIVQPLLKNQRRVVPESDCDPMMAEAISLVQTLQNWSVFDSMRVLIKSPSKKYMFGQGTFQDLTAQIRSQPAVTAVFLNVDRLSGVQKQTLEDKWGVPVLDRYELVLQIFKDHASTKEAKLQIALAEIHLRRSHLRQEVQDLDQQSGAQQFIGGGGETLLEKKHRLLRDKEGALKKAMGKLKNKRGLLREGRRKKHFPHIAVVGYTNAGKTSLIKALTGDARLQPEDRLFATLDVTSHLGCLSNRLPVIYIDTVGFISSLPHQLIASFAATLEDVLCADLILHVRDASHPNAEAQRINVLGVLHDLGVPQNLMEGMVEVDNKADLLPSSHMKESEHRGHLPVSATERTGLNQLKQVLGVKLLEVTDRVSCEVRIPQAGSHLSWLYKEATVQDISTVEGDAEHLLVEVVFSRSAYSRFQAKFGDLPRP